MDSSLKDKQRYFETLIRMGHGPLALRKWEYCFFDRDAARLRAFCGLLISEGFNYGSVKRDCGASDVPGWVVSVSEVAQHTPETLSQRIGELNELVSQNRIELFCEYGQKKPPTRSKKAGNWVSLWDAKLNNEQVKAQEAVALVAPEALTFFGRPAGNKAGFSGWIPFLNFAVKGSGLVLTELRPGPVKDGLRVSLEAGDYYAQVRGFTRGVERRCARLRVARYGCLPEKRGQVLGNVSTDMATLGFYDPKAFSALLRAGSEEFFEWGERVLDPNAPTCGVLVYDLKKSAILPYVQSGFGDGTFPVFELLNDGQRVGFEVEFISDASVETRQPQTVLD